MGATEDGPGSGGVKGEKDAAAGGGGTGGAADNGTTGNNDNADGGGGNNNEDAKHINLQVRGPDGNVVHFKIKKNTALKKLMNAYCQRANVERGAVRFLLEGRPVQENDTPTALEMEEGDTIECYKEQVGGGG